MSATGGQLVFTYNAFLQRDLNGLDIKDPVAFKQNLGISTTGTTYPALTFGSGLNSGTYNASQAATISVNTSTTGGASTIPQYDTSGNLTTSANANIGFGSATGAATTALNFFAGTTGMKAQINRQPGDNGVLNVLNTGSGGLVLNGGTGSVTIQSRLSVPSGVSGGLSVSGATTALGGIYINGGTTTDTLNVGNGGVFGAGNGSYGVGVYTDSLYVSGPANISGGGSWSGGGVVIDTLSIGGVGGSLTLPATSTFYIGSGYIRCVFGNITISDSYNPVTLGTVAASVTVNNVLQRITIAAGSGGTTLTGGLTADALKGACISDVTNGTSATIAASSKALGLVSASTLPLSGGRLTGSLLNSTQPSFSTAQAAASANFAIPLTELYPTRGFVIQSAVGGPGNGILTLVAGRYFISISPVWTSTIGKINLVGINYATLTTTINLTNLGYWSGVLDIGANISLGISGNGAGGTIYFSGYLIG
jgi:hypothetical protein